MSGPNIERDGDDVLICWNLHDKGEKCEYERFMPAQQLDAALARAEAAEFRLAELQRLAREQRDARAHYGNYHLSVLHDAILGEK